MTPPKIPPLSSVSLNNLLKLSLGPKEMHILLMLAALIGFVGALTSVVFRESIRGLEWLITRHDGGLVALAAALPVWERLLIPALGGAIGGFILQGIGGRLRGRTNTDYIEAARTGDGWISVRQSLVNGLSSLCSVATGGAIGREGAMVQLSAMAASAIGRIIGFQRNNLRLLVACGAAAGLASAYNAPIAATMFVAEIVLGSIDMKNVGPLIISSVIANATVHRFLGYAPVYDIPNFHFVSNWELGLYVLLGLLAGHLAPAFLALLKRSTQWFRRMPAPLYVRMAAGGFLVGAISAYEPQVWGNGYSVVNSILHSHWLWQSLLTVLALKLLATAFTIGSGAIGGAFTPTLFVGAALGALYGGAAHALFPFSTAPQSAYAVVGMGAMLAGTTYAPLMSILMVFELTGDYQIVLPLMLACVTAYYTVQRYRGAMSIYAESLLPRDVSH